MSAECAVEGRTKGGGVSEKTGISWADSTGNPWIGCTKVSPGCKNCYAAELDANKFSRTMGGATPENPISHWGKGAPRVRTKAFWKDALKWNAAQQEWRDRPCDPKFRPAVDAHPNPRIFPSLCDWLDDEVSIEWLADFLKLIHDTPNLDWLLLTKRPENWRDRIWQAKEYWGRKIDREKGEGDSDIPWYALCDWLSSGNSDQRPSRPMPPHNVWIGVSVEDQKRADERIPLLLQIPAKVHFVSAEPLLERIDFSKWFGGQS